MKLHLACWLLGLTFLAAGVPKLLEQPSEVAALVRNYRLLPETLVRWTAVTLPWTETLAGLCLLVGVLRRSAALLTASMSLGFLFALLSAMYRGLRIDCGCFGATGSVGLVTPPHLIADMLLLALSVFVLLYAQNVAQTRNRVA